MKLKSVTKVCRGCGKVASNVDVEFLIYLRRQGQEYKCSECDPLIDRVPDALTARWGEVICVASSE